MSGKLYEQWKECLERAAIGQQVLFVVPSMSVVRSLEKLVEMPEGMDRPIDW